MAKRDAKPSLRDRLIVQPNSKIVLGVLEDLEPAFPERPDLPPNLVLR